MNLRENIQRIKGMMGLINELSVNNLNGRKLNISGPEKYTIFVQSKNNQMVELKLSSNLGEINPKDIRYTKNGYELQGAKSGNWTLIDNDAINDIIEFVDDNTKRDLTISRKMGIVKIYVKKI